MQLYNSRTKTEQLFEPLSKDKSVRIYSCGPTVYERVHIGNLSAFIYADTLRRALETSGYQVELVMNITDVDDKTIKASQEKYPDLDPMNALKKLTTEYKEMFMKDIRAVGIDTDRIKFVKATDYIESMQLLIKRLVDEGFAYIADDGVYFSIKKYTDSGKKYGQLVDVSASSTSEARIDNDEYDKESAHDFALWKRQKPGEPAWDFEIDGHNLKGRPGWHIECSAMSVNELGQPFDIHTGGVDLKFPHHENEIAQSTAGNGDLLANFFFHNEHILVDGKKMSKSLNNFYTLKDIQAKGFEPLAFRLLVLQSHYSHQAHFSWENLQAAQSRLIRFRNLAELRYQIPQKEQSGSFDATMITTQKLDIKPAIENNMDIPGALAAIEKYIDGHLFDDFEHEYWLLDKFIGEIDALLGLNLASAPDITSDKKALIKQREEARQNQDWHRADELRQQLADQGVEINDTPHGPIWYRK